MDINLLAQLRDKEGTSRRLYVEVIDFATRLEQICGQHFKPYDGSQLYFESTFRPIIDFNKNSYYSNHEYNPLKPGETEQIPIRSLKDIGTVDVFDQLGRLVVRARDTIKLRVVPTDPIRMIHFITDYIQNYCHSRIPVFAKERKELVELIEEYLSEEALVEWRALKRRRPEDPELDRIHQRDVEDFINDVWMAIEPLMEKVREFIGDNNWMIYSVSESMWDLIIDGYVDYRVYVYHERELAEQEAARQAEEDKQVLAGEK
jgi:hypothetical protein